jgi:hypothetical protein
MEPNLRSPHALIEDTSGWNSLGSESSGQCMSEIGFHEKAGRSQVGSVVFLWDKVFFRRATIRYPSIRTLW